MGFVIVNYGKEKRFLTIWTLVVSVLMVHIGSSNSIVDRISNDWEYFKTLGFSLVVGFGAIFFIYYISLKIHQNVFLNNFLLATIVGSIASILTYFYFTYILEYEIEGSTLLTVDIPLIFFICFLTLIVFRRNKGDTTPLKDSLSAVETKIQGFRANSTVLIDTEELAYIRREHGINYVFLKNSEKFRTELSMRELEIKLGPHHFFRLNRQTLTSKSTVKKYEVIEGRKLKVLLKTENTTVFVKVSKEKSTSFKKWLSATN